MILALFVSHKDNHNKEIGYPMGAWDSGNFDNDNALDLIIEVVDRGGLKAVEAAFDAILNLDDYIDVDFGSEAIAAGEVVAMLRGKPAASIPDNLAEWHQVHQLSANDALTAKAILAVEKAFADEGKSELRELWEDSPEFQTVQANIMDLLSRLRS
jgi:hypothetical protein